MNTDAIRRFLTALSSASRVERGLLYQLIQSAEASCYLRDIESHHDLAIALQSFAYPFDLVGKYYESVYLHRTGQHQKARELLERIAESAPTPYRSKALLSLSAVEAHIGRFEESLRLRLQISSSCGADLVTLIEAQRGIAILKSLQGEHRAALRDLDSLMPLAHIIGKRGHPAYTDFLNSYAVELSEGNRAGEAEQVAKVIAASPFISRYPEWQETVSEIEAQRRRSSMVAVPHGHLIHNDVRIQTAIGFMDANFQRRIMMDDLAAAAHMSPGHFSRLFKIEVGLTPLNYLIRLRLEKARQLLKTTSLSVKQVMASVGYESKGHFARHFKRQYNASPSEYRVRFLRRR